jgi:hypothetical protein
MLAAACSKVQPSPVSQLTPYITPIEVKSTPAQTATQSTLLVPTSTPVIHVVAAGETMSAIALRYGVETSALMAANPSINPNAMSIGARINIPSQSSSGFTLGNSTPVPVAAGPMSCSRSRDGSIWCFLLVQNNQNLPVENLQARITVGNSQTGQAAEQLTTAPVNILYPAKTIALSAYFPSSIVDPLQTHFEMVSALAVQDGTSRYLETRLENLQITKGTNDLSAKIYGEVSLTDPKLGASAVWAAGVAYDNQGNVVGVRRWESSAPLIPGQKISFVFQVYSTGSTIDRVDVLLEARK